MSQSKDPLFKLKSLAYLRTKFPEGYETWELFLDHCKMTLSIKLKIPFKSEVWDRYTDEELVTEYFCHVYSTNEKEAEKIKGYIIKEDSEESFLDWTEKMMENTAKELEKKADELEDIHFSPEVIGD